MAPRTPSKWRPTLGMIAIVVLLTVLTLPMAGLIFFRLYENPLVQQTESELIAQSAVLASVMAEHIETSESADLPLGAELPDDILRIRSERYYPVEPELDLSRVETLGPRPDARPVSVSIHPAYRDIGLRLYPLIIDTQKVTLAGFRVLDPFGNVIAGRSEVGLSLGHIPEVRDALAGRYASVLRHREPHEQASPAYGSISRGTGVRIFAALPVVVGNRVAGVIYSSRTPNNIIRKLNQQRDSVLLAASIVIIMTLLLALVFSRTITGPIHQLINRTERIGEGDRAAIAPLKRHGSRETAMLSQSFLDMAEKLFDRTNYIANFAAHVSHEFKSPLTSIQGAAELLRDARSEMTDAERDRFLDNIQADSARLTTLVQRLRDLARADNPQTGGSCTVVDAVNEARQGFDRLEVVTAVATDLSIPMSGENAQIVLKHLFENAAEHGAKRVDIAGQKTGDSTVLHIRDDGEGIPPEHRNRIFDAFFTTKREAGGTGMGLGIVQLMLRAHAGSISVADVASGACFEIAFQMPKSLP